LYEEHGDAFVDRLRGMFGLALWDARRRRLVLSARSPRDHSRCTTRSHADGLVFGSEQKAILASGLMPAEPDLHALRQVLTYGRVIAPRTMVTGIQRLLPGHLLVWCDGRAELRQYWDCALSGARGLRTRGHRRSVGRGAARAELADSVRVHLRSDVPVGAALSAGIDSSQRRRADGRQ
jgi:asparagine synthase (glutamine-hydrolysing)